MNTHYRDHVVALQIREETFIHESSAHMDSNFMKLKHESTQQTAERVQQRAYLGFQEICLTLEGLMMELAEPA